MPHGVAPEIFVFATQWSLGASISKIWRWVSQQNSFSSCEDIYKAESAWFWSRTLLKFFTRIPSQLPEFGEGSTTRTYVGEEEGSDGTTTKFVKLHVVAAWKIHVMKRHFFKEVEKSQKRTQTINTRNNQFIGFRIQIPIQLIYLLPLIERKKFSR